MIYRMNIKNIDDMELNEVAASIKEIWAYDYDYDDFFIDITTDGAYVYAEVALKDDEDYWCEGNIVYNAIDFEIDDEKTKEKENAERDASALLTGFGFKRPRR